MHKKYIVRLTEEECKICDAMIDRRDAFGFSDHRLRCTPLAKRRRER